MKTILTAGALALAMTTAQAEIICTVHGGCYETGRKIILGDGGGVTSNVGTLNSYRDNKKVKVRVRSIRVELSTAEGVKPRPQRCSFRAPIKRDWTMKNLLLATAFAAIAFAAPAQAQSVTSGCRAAGQALGYATGDRYLGQRYHMNCQILSPYRKSRPRRNICVRWKRRRNERGSSKNCESRGRPGDLPQQTQARRASLRRRAAPRWPPCLVGIPHRQGGRPPAHHLRQGAPRGAQANRPRQTQGNATMRKQTQIYSIFGQIECVVAEAMIAEGTCRKIPFDDIPISARYHRMPDGKDVAAKFALVIPSNLVNIFEKRILDLRA